MIDAMIFNAIWDTMDQFPRIEWEAQHDFTMMHFYMKEGQRCFRESHSDRPAPMGVSMVRATLWEGSREHCIKQSVSDYILKETTRPEIRHMLERMAMELGLAYVKTAPE